jgi:hypothetical protein
MTQVATNTAAVRSSEVAESAETVAAADGATNTREPRPLYMPVFVSREELFFWTQAWQEGERESAAAREAGEVVEFDSATDLLKWLLSDED